MAKKNTTAPSTSSHSLPVRLLALIMTGLVASGALVYLIMFLMSLFGK